MRSLALGLMLLLGSGCAAWTAHRAKYAEPPASADAPYGYALDMSCDFAVEHTWGYVVMCSPRGWVKRTEPAGPPVSFAEPRH